MKMPLGILQLTQRIISVGEEICVIRHVRHVPFANEIQIDFSPGKCPQYVLSQGGVEIITPP
jgi:hypothetical protein